MHSHDGLSVVFSLTNYGTAPAVVLSIAGALFPIPGPKATLLTIQSGSQTIVDFPEPNALFEFRAANQRWPLDHESYVSFVKWRGESPTFKEVQTTGFVAPAVIGAGKTTGNFKITGRIPFQDQVKGMRIEGAMNMYFIGSIAYSGSDDTIHTVDFCYASGPHGVLQTFRGKPYNDRNDHKPTTEQKTPPQS